MAAPLLPGHLLLIVVVAIILLLAAAALYWAHRSGQLRDIEEPKHRMLEEPWNDGWGEDAAGENRQELPRN